MNQQLCALFLENPLINPITGRHIMKDGAVYKQLMKDCQKYYPESMLPNASPPILSNPNISLPQILSKPNISGIILPSLPPRPTISTVGHQSGPLKQNIPTVGQPLSLLKPNIPAVGRVTSPLKPNIPTVGRSTSPLKPNISAGGRPVDESESIQGIIETAYNTPEFLIGYYNSESFFFWRTQATMLKNIILSTRGKMISPGVINFIFEQSEKIQQKAEQYQFDISSLLGLLNEFRELHAGSGIENEVL